jgi:hypothetical protein
MSEHSRPSGILSVSAALREVLRLGAAARIREHRDYDLGYEEGQVRLHVRIVTGPEVDFFLDAHRLEMNEGECWYLDLSLPHWVENRGATDRIHLVIDCELNEWLRNLLPTDKSGDYDSAFPFSDDELSCPAELERFRSEVLNDLNLQRRLRQTSDQKSFIRLMLEVARECGYHFAATDVENAMRKAQRAWFERWID